MESKLIISAKQEQILRPVLTVILAILGFMIGIFIAIVSIGLGFALLPIPFIGFIIGPMLIFFGVVGGIASPITGIKVSRDITSTR